MVGNEGLLGCINSEDLFSECCEANLLVGFCSLYVGHQWMTSSPGSWI